MPQTFDDKTIQAVIDFHGHSCPGLAIGIRASELALRELPETDKKDLVAVAETDMCGVDAIQFLTGCTLGKGNFLHRDLGKMAFSFYDRKTGKGVRALLAPGARGEVGGELAKLTRLEANSKATEADLKRIDELRTAMQNRYMTLPLDEMFTITAPQSPLPRPPKILESRICDHCGEAAMESRVRLFGGQTLCLPCFNAVEQKV